MKQLYIYINLNHPTFVYYLSDFCIFAYPVGGIVIQMHNCVLM